MFSKGSNVGGGADGTFIMGLVIMVMVMVCDCRICNQKQQ